MRTKSDFSYVLPSRTTSQLDSLVDAIEARPGDLIGPHEFDCYPQVNIRGVLSRLPAGLGDDDFVGILKLAMLTESATESYEATICEAADRHDATWLRRFVTRVWSPDEATHFAPYKLFLLELGFSENELDREVRETRDKHYEHVGGLTPLHITTFGMIQEYLTDSYHGLIAGALRKAAPTAAAMVMRIKRRETLHSVWYRDMTALQVEANPGAVAGIVHEIDRFQMPGTSLVPDLQAQGTRWQLRLGADSDQLFRDLFRYVQVTLQDVRKTGELVMRLAAQKNVRLGPIPTKVVDGALRRLGSPGYGIIGEAALERAGLGYMFANQAGRQDSAYHRHDGRYEAIRGLVRSWIAGLIPPPNQVVFGSACETDGVA